MAESARKPTMLEYMEKEGCLFIPGDVRPGGKVIVRGKLIDNFASVSYIGMDYYQKADEVFKKYISLTGMGVQMAKFFIYSDEMVALEKELGEICGGRVLFTPCASVASSVFTFSVLAPNDIVVEEKDRIHMSFSIYGCAAKQRGTVFTSVNVMEHGDAAISEIKKYAAEAQKKGGRVWYATDAWDSSYGRHLPWDKLREIAEIGGNVGVFIDDAHGFWAFGNRGKGSFLEHVPFLKSVVISVSLNKSFSGYGGFLAFSNDNDQDYYTAKYRGLPMYFQGSVPPPVVSMNLEIAKFSKTEDFANRQKDLNEKSRYVHDRFVADNVPNTADPEIPLKFVHTGYIAKMITFQKKMVANGYCVFPMFNPAVPKGHAGIRITITTDHSYEKLKAMCDAVSELTKELALPPFSERVRDPFFD